MKSHAKAVVIGGTAIADADLRVLVERELDRFVEIGRKRFLNEKGLIRSAGSTYFIRWKDVDCDLKAIWKAALGVTTSARVGTPSAIQKRLEPMGFKVITVAENPMSDIPGTVE